MAYTINWETNGVIVRFQGNFNLKENNNVTFELLNAPQFESLEYIINGVQTLFEHFSKPQHF